MIRRMGEIAYRIAYRWIPDPFILAIVLTFVTFLAGIIFSPLNNYADNGAAEVLNAGGRMLSYWSDGFWSLLEFGMQMCLILVLGGTLARSQMVNKIITSLANLPRSGASAAALVAFCACVAALLNWGLGLIVGAFLARRVAITGLRKGFKIHYPLLGAAGYSGLMIWHGGLSGSGPLALNTPDSGLILALGAGNGLPLEMTLFSPLNLTVCASMLILVPVICYLLNPKDGESEMPTDMLAWDELEETIEETDTPARKIEYSRWPTLLIGLMGMAVVFLRIFNEGLSLRLLNLNNVNWMLLFVALLLHENARSFLFAIRKSAPAASGIILSFPFYFGIMGMITQSGMVDQIANFFVSISNNYTYPLFTFISAGIVNIFVPSGGGQVVVQGPIVLAASEQLGSPFNLAFMAMVYGDQWTNMLQPFWALPLLGLTGLKAKDLLGYTIVIMLLCGPVFMGLLVLFTLL